MKKFDALKWLCLLSLIGFIYCFVFDLGYFTLFLDVQSNSSQANSFLNIIIDNLSDNGFGSPSSPYFVAMYPEILAPIDRSILVI